MPTVSLFRQQHVSPTVLKPRVLDPEFLEAFARYGVLDPQTIAILESGLPWRRSSLFDLLAAREYHERELAALGDDESECLRVYHDCGVGEIDRELQRRARQPSPQHPAPRRLTEEFLRRLKEEVPLHEYAHYLGVRGLKRSGRERYVGLCPAHGERTGSFTVWRDHFYCVTADTPVLTADLNWKAIGSVEPGDLLAGFDEEPTPGKQRSLLPSRVLAHRISDAPIARIHTSAGEQSATLDHRWLVAYGPSHGRGFAGNVWRETRDLLPGTQILRLLPFDSWSESDLYGRGYLAGLADGDGTRRFQPGDTSAYYPYWRVAITDPEPLERVLTYLHAWGVSANIRSFSTPPIGEPRGSRNIVARKPMQKIDVRNLAGLRIIHNATQWIEEREFLRGYLAGIFDAEGGVSGADLVVVTNRDEQVLARTLRALSEFSFVATRRWAGEHIPNLVLVGTLSEKVRFFACTGPATRRKAAKLLGRAIRWDTATVKRVEIGGREPIVEILTETKTIITAGLASHNCFGCTATGDVFELARTLELGGGAATFLDAVRVVAQYARVPMPEPEGALPPLATSNARALPRVLDV